MAGPRAVKLAAASAIAAVSIALSLAAGEAMLRLIDFSYPAFHMPEEIAGFRLRPGAKGWYRDEGNAYVRINSDGWRDAERARAKPANTVRIAVLGDSFIEAVQVPQEATFTSQLEQELNYCQPFGKKSIEVLNFGVSSYGTAQQLIALRHWVRDYSPDIVLLAFLPSNDVRNNSRKLESWKARPFFEMKDGELRLDASFRDDPGFQDKRRSMADHAFLYELRLHQLMRRVRDGAYRGWNDAPAAAAAARGDASLAEAGITERVYHPPSDTDWQEAWEVTERLVEEIHREAKGIGAQFMVLVLSSGAAVHPDRSIRQRYAETIGVQDLFYPDRRIQALGAARGFVVVPLGEPMQRLAEKTGAFLHGFSNTQLGFGHWNVRGHRVAAELVASRFCNPPRKATN